MPTPAREACLRDDKPSVFRPKVAAAAVQSPEPAGAYLVVRQAGDAGPHLLGGRAQSAEDLEELVNLRVSREEGAARDHLGKDAANRPHVNRAGVLAPAKEDLRSTIPQGNHLQAQA